jgi:TonB family protein
MMIPRILVPKNARPAEFTSDAPPTRLSSDLDARTLIPPDLPQFELDPHSAIPSYFKLEVLGAPVVVPRDNMPTTPLDATSRTPDYVQLTILDSRVAVPKNARVSNIEPRKFIASQDLPDVIDPDVLTTGEVNLMARPIEASTSAWNTAARFGSIGLHFVVILLILFGPKVFPNRQSTTAEIARDNVTDLYMPPDLKNIPKIPARPQPKAPPVRIDPRLLRQLAPPRQQQPAPAEPEHVTKDNPVATKPSPLAPMPHPQDSPIRPQTLPDVPTPNLTIPRFSPGKALQDSMHEALKDGGTASAQFGGPVPGGGGMGGGSGGGGGGGQGYLGGGLQMLTPTEGVDFSNYLARVLASVKRNWYAVMPESANLGERGKVILQFRITRNGVVPEGEPVMMGSSGKDPLDRAAVSSIRASTPFEPLPSAFSGPYIELRFTYLYNIPQNVQ